MCDRPGEPRSPAPAATRRQALGWLLSLRRRTAARFGPDASSVTRIMQQVGGSFGTAVLAVILVGHSLRATFWWTVAFTGPGGAARGYAAPPRGGQGAGPGGGTRSGRRMTVSRRGDGTATGQLASAQTVRPG